MTTQYPPITAGLRVRHRETLEERTVKHVDGADAYFTPSGWAHLTDFWKTYEPLPQPGDRVRVVRSNHAECIGIEGILVKATDTSFYVSGRRGDHGGPLSDFEVILPEVEPLPEGVGMATPPTNDPWGIEPETVSVPVELLKRIIAGGSFRSAEVEALLPKAKPKWVMVNIDTWTPVVGFEDWLRRHPDAFDVIDTVIDDYCHLDSDVPLLKAAVRKAFEDGADK